MYVPTPFADDSPEFLRSLVSRFALAAVVVHGEDGLFANHIPLLWRAAEPGLGLLCGHISRANPLALVASRGCECLAVFQGVQGYISPNGYATKAEHGRVVPTWNYEACHVRGRMRMVEGTAWLEQLLVDLTAEHEASQPQPWRLDEAPREHIEKLMSAVVGIEIRIESWTGKAKLSQNQSAENRTSLVTMLRSRSTLEELQMAAAIESKFKSDPTA